MAVVFSLLCQKRDKKSKSDADEEMLELVDDVDETDYDKDAHLYVGEEVGDLIVGKLPDEEYLDEDNELAKRKADELLPGEHTKEKKGIMRIVSHSKCKHPTDLV